MWCQVQSKKGVGGLCHLLDSSLFWRLSLPLFLMCRRDVIAHQSHFTSALPSLVTHTGHCPLIMSSTVPIALAINMSDVFACLFLLFLLTLPLHEVTIPLFFFLHFFPFTFYPTFFFFSWFSCFVFFGFVLFVLFLTTASWNRSG